MFLKLFKKETQEERVNRLFKYFFNQFEWSKVRQAKEGYYYMNNSGIVAFNKKIKTADYDYLLNKIKEKEYFLKEEREIEIVNRLKDYLVDKREKSYELGYCKNSAFLKRDLTFLCDKILS